MIVVAKLRVDLGTNPREREMINEIENKLLLHLHCFAL